VSVTTDRQHTIVVAGGGPVGLTVAALLATGAHAERLDIRLLEHRAAPCWDPEHMDLRVFALSRASQCILNYLGIWEEILAARASSYRRMHVWEGELAARLGSLTFDSADIAEPDLGHIVEDRLIRDRLAAVLRALPSVRCEFGVKVEALRIVENAVEVQISGGETVSAALLIAADGSASTVRSLVNLPQADVSYAQDAVVTHVITEKPHAETAWQRFLPGGPLAFLPLSDGRSSVVWSVRSEQARGLLESSAGDFLHELQLASGGVLGAMEAAARRGSYPLRAAHTYRYCRPRVALVGDAAHVVHPLAGQGMNLGLLDAAGLADTLAEALASGQDPGDLRALRRYERQRKGENLKMLLALDGLHRLFRFSGPLSASVRAAGLSAVNAAPFAKRLLMREALGLRGKLPTVARARVA